MAISYLELRDGAAGTAVGIRCRTELQPLGGAGDKVFPPTYGVPTARPRPSTRSEERLVPSADGGAREVVQAVVLDSLRHRRTGLSWRCLTPSGGVIWRCP